jgi:hypothetical protein
VVRTEPDPVEAAVQAAALGLPQVGHMLAALRYPVKVMLADR